MPVVEIGRRDGAAAGAGVPPMVGDRDDTLGIRIGERAQEHGVDDGEDGGIGADAERERRDRQQRERRLAAKGTPGVAEVLDEAIHSGLDGLASRSVGSLFPREGCSPSDRRGIIGAMGTLTLRRRPPLAFASPVLAAGRPIAPTDLLGMARISDPQMSPDGTRVLDTVATPDLSANRTARDVWMVTIATGEERAS